MPATLLILPVVGRLHAPRIQNQIDQLVDQLTVHGLKVHLHDIHYPGSSPPEIDEGAYDAVVVLAGSGGISRTLVSILSHRRWVLWAYRGNNSLPAALSAREKLRSSNAWRGFLATSPEQVVWIARLLHAVHSGIRLTVVNPRSERLQELRALEKYGFRIESRHVAKSALEAATPSPHKLPPPPKDAASALKLLSVLRQNPFDALTVDCFPLLTELGVTPCLALAALIEDDIPAICEADVAATLVATAVQIAIRTPFWMANLVEADAINNRLLFAHCTIAPSLTADLHYTPHFESGFPLAVRGYVKPGPVTILYAPADLSYITTFYGEILSEQPLRNDACRTQAWVRPSVTVDRILRTVGNHHILVLGRYSRLADAIGWVFNIPVHPL
ncbi:hypothetical protein DRN94_001430 [archaeon]|nr:hypothetical protein [archaeon]